MKNIRCKLEIKEKKNIYKNQKEKKNEKTKNKIEK